MWRAMKGDGGVYCWGSRTLGPSLMYESVRAVQGYIRPDTAKSKVAVEEVVVAAGLCTLCVDERTNLVQAVRMKWIMKTQLTGDPH